MRVDEIVVVDPDPDGGYNARAVGESIFTQADTREQLVAALWEAIGVHFAPERPVPKLLRLLG